MRRRRGGVVRFQQLGTSGEDAFVQGSEVDEGGQDVGKERIHADDFEREAPGPQVPDVDDEIEQGEQEHADAACSQNEGGGPDAFDDGVVFRRDEEMLSRAAPHRKMKPKRMRGVHSLYFSAAPVV